MREEFDLSNGKPDTASTTEKAREWFMAKARPTKVIDFRPVKVGLYEFTAMIVPLWDNDGLNTPVRHEGFVSVQGEQADGTPRYALEYSE